MIVLKNLQKINHAQSSAIFSNIQNRKVIFSNLQKYPGSFGSNTEVNYLFRNLKLVIIKIQHQHSKNEAQPVSSKLL